MPMVTPTATERQKRFFRNAVPEGFRVNGTGNDIGDTWLMGSDFTDHIAYSLPWDPINNPHVGQVLEYEFDQTWHDLRVANPLDFSLNTQHVQVNVRAIYGLACEADGTSNATGNLKLMIHRRSERLGRKVKASDAQACNGNCVGYYTVWLAQFGYGRLSSRIHATDGKCGEGGRNSIM